MQINFTDKELFVLKNITNAAKEMGVSCFLIGGFVRDKVIGRSSKDADIVCLGDGIALAHKVAENFHPKPTVAHFKTFGTAQLKLYNFFQDDTKASSPPESVWEEPVFEIEFVGARKESYNYNSRKPEVETGTLEDDQNRRDFTITHLQLA